MQLQQLKCSVCGANLHYNEVAQYYFCEHCRSEFKVKQEIPANVVMQLNIAGNERENYAFSRARKAYEAIIEQNDSIVEAHWGLLLSKYGIEYVEDKRANSFVPTCHRASSVSIFEDPCYAKIMFLDGFDSEYIQKAKQIENIRQKIIDTATKESPYDIFICYKDKDGDGNPTQESLQANDLYHMLVDSGYKVFFARKSLDSLAGNQFEPVIYNAINTASIMFLFCNKIQYVDSPWVKNEWGRFIELTEINKKTLVPILCGLDPNALPIELTRLQGLDISKVGFEGSIRELVSKTFGKANPDVKYCNHCLSLSQFSSKFCQECGSTEFSLTPQEAFNASKAQNSKTNDKTSDKTEDIFSKPKIVAKKITTSIASTITKVSNSVASTLHNVFDDDPKKENTKKKESHKKEKKCNDNIDPFKFEKVDPFMSAEKCQVTVDAIKQKKPSITKIVIFAILLMWCFVLNVIVDKFWVLNSGTIIFGIFFVVYCVEYSKKVKIQNFVCCKQRVTVSVVSSMLKSKKAIEDTQKFIQKMITKGEIIGYHLDGNILVRN